MVKWGGIGPILGPFLGLNRCTMSCPPLQHGAELSTPALSTPTNSAYDRTQQKPINNFGKSSHGRSQGLPQIFRASVAYIGRIAWSFFVIAQMLSYLLLFPKFAKLEPLNVAFSACITMFYTYLSYVSKICNVKGDESMSFTIFAVSSIVRERTVALILTATYICTRLIVLTWRRITWIRPCNLYNYAIQAICNTLCGSM